MSIPPPQGNKRPGFMVLGVVSRVYTIIGGMLVKSQRNVFLIYNFFAYSTPRYLRCSYMSLTAKSAYPYNAGKLCPPASYLSESGQMNMFFTAELSFQNDGTDFDIRLQ